MRMLEVPHRSVRPWDELELPDAFARHLPDPDPFIALPSLPAHVVRAVRNRRTVRFELGGRRYYAKIHEPMGWRGIARELIRLKWPVVGAANERAAVDRVTALGIHTTSVVAYGRRGRSPARRESFLVTADLEPTQNLERFCEDWASRPPPLRLKRALMRRVASIARTLHDNGINHRDFYLCHFRMDLSRGQPAGADDLRLYLMDLHRVQMRRATPYRARLKDVAALYFSAMDIGLSRADRLRFIRLYTGRPLRAALGEDAAFWSAVARRADGLYRDFHDRPPPMPPPQHILGRAL